MRISRIGKMGFPVQTQNNKTQNLPLQSNFPADKATKVLIADISLKILESGGGNFIDSFAKAAGEAIGADMLLVSRVKSKHIPVETYALYDRSGQTEHYTYPIVGTPCEQVFDTQCSLTVHKELAACFPEDKDLVEFGLHSYIGTPLVGEKGEPIGLIAALWNRSRENLDIEIKALEYFAAFVAADMLQREANARNELSVAGASSGAWYTDFESHIEYFSDAARRIIGHPDLPAQSKRKTLLGLMQPGEQRILRAAFHAYSRGEAPYDCNFRFTPPNGDPRWLRMTGKAEYNANGRMTAIAGDITDISELVEAKRTAEAASSAKSDFLATMSHEIRTPMNGVLSMAGILAEADIPKEHKRQAHVIKKSGEAMMVILNDVLDLSKIEAGKLDLEARSFSPRELLEDVCMLWRDTIETKGVEFLLDIKDSVPESVVGDETRLRQVLSNLLSNALKFTETGTICLSLDAQENTDPPSLKFSVSDSGIGIAKAQQKNLFSAFDQANSSISRRFGGTGLGLSISDKIVRMMGGQFEIESAPRKGSTFSFTIKANMDCQTATPESKPEIIAPIKADNVPKSSKRSILIAEDNEINRSVLQAFLSRLPVTLTFAENGSKAVELANAQPFDIILMDVQMPILDGVRATRKIRVGNGPCAKAPIIALTANAMPGDQQRFLDAGMTGYVSKPIDPAALYKALKEAAPISDTDHTDKAVSG